MTRGGFVSIAGLSKVYETREDDILALEDVSFEVQQGEFLSIVGPSGCGKSTMLLIVAGLVPGSGGSIAIDGVKVEKPQTNLGFVFQDAVLLDWRRVIDNVMLSVEFRGRDQSRYRKRAIDLLEAVGLGGFEKKYPYELSGGMRQRVSICRALIHDPPLLLMDEPFGALDALTRDQLNLDLQTIWQESKKTVLFVTHSIAEAVFLSDRVVVMSPRPGKVSDILRVDLPRPRSHGVRETPAFAEYTKAIRSIFQAQGVLRDTSVTMTMPNAVE